MPSLSGITKTREHLALQDTARGLLYPGAQPQHRLQARNGLESSGAACGLPLPPCRPRTLAARKSWHLARGRATRRRPNSKTPFSIFAALDTERKPQQRHLRARLRRRRQSLAGRFRNGVDVFAPDGKELAHLESDPLARLTRSSPTGKQSDARRPSQAAYVSTPRCVPQASPPKTAS